MALQQTSVNKTYVVHPHQSNHFNAIREVGKADRLALTDAIKAFNEYTGRDGKCATRPDLAYSNMTRTIYAPFGLNVKQRTAKELSIEARNTFAETELTYLQVAERTAAEYIRAGMKRGDSRVDIKNRVKEMVHKFADVLKDIRSMREMN